MKEIIWIVTIAGRVQIDDILLTVGQHKFDILAHELVLEHYLHISEVLDQLDDIQLRLQSFPRLPKKLQNLDSIGPADLATDK